MKLLQFRREPEVVDNTFVRDLIEAVDTREPDLIDGKLYERRQELDKMQDRKTVLEREISERTEELRQVNILIADGNRSVAELTAGKRIAAE